MKIQVILGTNRPSRASERVAKWVVESAKSEEGFEVELVDLADYPVPHFDEAISPRFNPNRKPNEIAAKWLAKISEADGYIFVTPEYNHSFPGILKDALDYVAFEMLRKPATIVSHGTVGGARAAEQLKLVLTEARTAIIPEAVTLMGVNDILDEQGNLSVEAKARPYGPQIALDSMLASLAWYTEALTTARTAEVAKV